MISLSPRSFICPASHPATLSRIPRIQTRIQTRRMTVPAQLQQASEANKAKLWAIGRDFRTDTITVPTDEMLLTTLTASRGDDVYHEDATTTAFQARVAALTGKEAALFCVSGTMTNQLALRTHLHQPPHSILCDVNSHINKYEAAGAAFHSQAGLTTVTPKNGHHLTLEDDILPQLIMGDDIHTAPTRIIALENTLNGLIFPQSEIERISAHARHEGIVMHLDGARLWNVHAETGLSIQELCAPFDTVSLCISKGLGAPVGSVLVGPKKFIEKARWFRKLFGGGIRQSGGLAAAADYALTHHLLLLKETHVLARRLSEGLSELGVKILAPVETSMVFIDATPLSLPLATLIARAAALPEPITFSSNRLVMHFQTSPQAVDDLVGLVRTLKEELRERGELPEEEEVRRRQREGDSGWGTIYARVGKKKEEA